MTTAAEHGWQLSGSTADAYATLLVPTIFEPWAQALVERVDPQPGERVLDLACGTGVVARVAAPRVLPTGTVTGVDVNPGMLATARSTAPEGEAILWHAADALELPFPAGSFDLVVCQQGLQFVTDLPAVAREARRVLDAGGRLAVSVWRGIEHNHGFGLLAQVLDRHSARAGHIMRSPFALDDQDEIRQVLVDAGFDQVQVLIDARICRFPSAAELLRYEVLSSPLAEPIGQMDASAHDALVADVEATLASCTDDEGLAITMESHLVLAM